MGMPDHSWGLPFVEFDQEAAGRLCVEHLLGLGHTAIGLLGSAAQMYDKRLACVHRFRAGAAAALQEAQLPAPFAAIEASRSGVEHALRRLIEQTPGLTGLIVDNNTALSAVMDALSRTFPHIPSDLSVIANCPDRLAEHQPIPLTHVPLPTAELGCLAVDLLVKRIRGESVESILIAPELREGASTARLMPRAANRLG